MVARIEYIVKNIKTSIRYKEKTNYAEILKFVKRVKQNKQKTLKFFKQNIKLGKNISLWCLNKR